MKTKYLFITSHHILQKRKHISVYINPSVLTYPFSQGAAAKRKAKASTDKVTSATKEGMDRLEEFRIETPRDIGDNISKLDKTVEKGASEAKESVGSMLGYHGDGKKGAEEGKKH